jgi:ribosomal protein S18 acetylase RimI-like enzyme
MAHPDLCIRPFARADQAAVRRLILTGLGEHFGHIDESLNPDLADIHATYIQPGHVFVVACLAGELAGTGALRLHDALEGELVRISVSPTRRRQGIGQALVAHLIAAARQRGLTRLLVETNHDWYDAINLYKRFGFTEYDRDATNVYLHLDLA